KKPAATRPQIHLAVEDFKGFAMAAGRRIAPSGPGAVEFQKEADRILLGRYAPPGVLVNEHFDIVQFRGRTNSYLESPPGEPTSNLFKMAKEGLFLELR